MSDLERARLVMDAIFKVRSLAKSDPSTKVGKAIALLDIAREGGASDLSIYNAVLKVLHHDILLLGLRVGLLLLIGC